MTHQEQQMNVRRLAARSTQQSAEIAGHRRAVQAWKRKRLATPGALALFFAAGTLWGSSEDRQEHSAGKSKIRGKAASAANFSWFLWRFFSDPASDDSP